MRVMRDRAISPYGANHALAVVAHWKFGLLRARGVSITPSVRGRYVYHT
jgi:hypothetical protein